MSEGSPATQLKAIFARSLQKPADAPSSSSATYQERPALQNAFRLGGQSAIAGVILAGLRNSLAGKNMGIMGPVGLFTAVGATFAMTESVVANQRETNDALNGASGACAAGFLLGLRARSLPVAVGGCTIMGGVMGLYDYTVSTGDRKETSRPQKGFFKSTAVVEAVKT
ncbi:hypothetical protein B0H15DRAFT_1017275 [Mycena belliarum]|uniref:Complex I-B14.7 n=1 Tax=Mycena belliarum TaxID=1033014 RepID=A0AAD6UHX2_9AGAR|nr:hypothetical protein B0H15DRAFT_1017275 [Mycena belliae]